MSGWLAGWWSGDRSHGRNPGSTTVGLAYLLENESLKLSPELRTLLSILDREPLASLEEADIAQCFREGRRLSLRRSKTDKRSVWSDYKAELIGLRVENLTDHNTTATRLTDRRIKCQQLKKQIAELEEELKETQQEVAKLQKDVQILTSEGLSPDSPVRQSIDEARQCVEKIALVGDSLLNSLDRALESPSPDLVALDDGDCSKPTLSLFLQCMHVSPAGIEAVRELNSEQFLTQSVNGANFAATYGGKGGLSGDDIKDLLYSAEMLRSRSLWGHQDDCVVCGQQAPEQLVQFLKERKIDNLSAAMVRQKRLNGPRLLHSSLDDFLDGRATKAEREKVSRALVQVREIHQQVLRSQ